MVSGPWVMHGRLIVAQGLVVMIDRSNCRGCEVLCLFKCFDMLECVLFHRSPVVNP